MSSVRSVRSKHNDKKRNNNYDGRNETKSRSRNRSKKSSNNRNETRSRSSSNNRNERYCHSKTQNKNNQKHYTILAYKCEDYEGHLKERDDKHHCVFIKSFDLEHTKITKDIFIDVINNKIDIKNKSNEPEKTSNIIFVGEIYWDNANDRGSFCYDEKVLQTLKEQYIDVADDKNNTIYPNGYYRLRRNKKFAIKLKNNANFVLSVAQQKHLTSSKNNKNDGKKFQENVNDNNSSEVKIKMEHYDDDFISEQKISHGTEQNIPSNLTWHPLQLWVRWNEENDTQAQWALAPMEKRIAGSCHELVVAYLKSSKGEILTRLIKLARDKDEDNRHHFETERKVSQYLTHIATYINRCYHSRADVCIWPVETIYFEYNCKMKWATVQAPFLSKDNSVFVKIEPNSGKPCVNDPVVGRYQHVFAAFTCGLDLVRDWQGYSVPQSVFLKQCKITQTEEAIQQIRIRPKPETTQVLIVIDPVLITCASHFETNNPTDFGIKAIDEWLQTHGCERCRCRYFYLTKDIRFCISDPGQKFFEDDAPMYLIQNVKKLRKELNIWSGDNWTPPSNDEDNNNFNNSNNNNNNNNKQ